MSKPVFIHSDIARSMPLYEDIDRGRSLNESCNAASMFLLDKYGDNLSFPVFNYNFGKSLVFDIDNDKSQTGTLPEYIRLSGDYCRSPVPFFSTLSKNNELCQYSPECHPFGSGSFFEWLHHSDGKIVGFGTKSIFTFLHYIEELVPGGPLYRYEKEFNGLLKTKEGNKKIVCKMHVRPKNGATEYDFNLIEYDLRKDGILVNDDKYGILCSMQCSEVVPYILSKYENDPLYGLTERSKLALMKLTNNCTSRIKACDDLPNKNNTQYIVNESDADVLVSGEIIDSNISNGSSVETRAESFSLDDVIDVVSSVLTEEEITVESSMDNTYTWDSLNHIAIIVALKNQLSIDFDTMEIVNITSIKKIYNKAYEG
jgi:aminoglycoside N3'-acetyltransferase/acyl carrier protein